MPAPYFADEHVAIFHGNALEYLRLLPSDCIDAVLTDPPYSSGGAFRSDRNQDPVAKYVSWGTEKVRASFTGDNRDGRSWGYWCSLWMHECLRIVRESGYLLTFTDWRMLPTASDALQSGGWVWRGVVTWDKTEGSRAPHTGYFRHQCEHVVWGTRGVSRPASWGGPWPGCVRYPVRQADKFHLTGKPLSVLNELVVCVPPGGCVLDPFMGSGTTLVAARGRGRTAVGFDLSEAYCEIAAKRLQQSDLGLVS